MKALLLAGNRRNEMPSFGTMTGAGACSNTPGVADPDWRTNVSERTCSVEGCEQSAKARGWCNMHYYRMTRYGSPDNPRRPAAAGPCIVDRCDHGGPFSRGLCGMHWQRLHNTGQVGEPWSRTRDHYANFWDYVEKNGPVPPHRPELGPCWEWTAGVNGPGYGTVRVGDQLRTTHRVVWEMCVGPLPDGAWVLHHCDNRLCVNFERHLFLGDSDANVQDREAKGRTWTRLNSDQVRKVRERIANGETHKAIGDSLGVAASIITNINTGKTWKRLK